MRRAFGDAILPSVCKQGEAKADLEKHLPQNPKLPAIAARGSPVLVPVPACIPNGLGGLLASYKPLPLSSCSGEPAGVSQLPAKL